MQQKYAKLMFEHMEKNPTSVAESVVFNTDTPRELQTLMFDVDTTPEHNVGEIKHNLIMLFSDKSWTNTGKGHLRMDDEVWPHIIESASGLHIITKPFNRNLFNERVKAQGKFTFANEANPSDIEYFHTDTNKEAFGIKENANVLLYFNSKK